VKRRIKLKIREGRTQQAPADRFEQLLESVGSAEVLSEGLWSKVKYIIGKAGSIEKGGSIFGSGKKAKKAQEFIDRVIEKKSNDLIKKLDAEIRDQHPEFPNQEDKFDFQNAAASILAVYWSIVAAAGQCGDGGVDCGEGVKNLKPGDEGYLDVSIANEIIKDLESYAKYIADYKLADSYKHFTEGKSLHSKIPLTIQEAQRLDELFGLSSKEKMAKAVAASERGEDEEDSDAQRDALFNKDKKTSSWKGLESNLLPGVLALLGGGFTLAHLIAPYVLPQPGTIETITKKQHLKATINFVTTNGDTLSATAAKGSNLTGFVANLSGAPGNAATMGDFANQINNIATTTSQSVGNVTSAISQGLTMPSADAAKMMHFMHDFGVANPAVGYGQIVNATAPSQQFVNFVATTDPSFASTISSGASGAGTFKGGLTNVLGINPGAVSVAGAAITKAVFKFYTVTTITKGAVAAVPGGATAIAGSGALLTIGVSLLAAAAAVKLLRMKGKHSSRLKVLQDIVNQINPIEGGEPEPGPEPGPEPDPETDTAPGAVEEDCVEAVKAMDKEFQVGDYVLYEERQSSRVDGDYEPESSVGVIMDKGEGIEADMADPRYYWSQDEEIQEAQGSMYTGKNYTHRIFWNIWMFPVRTMRNKHMISVTTTSVAVFRKEGDEGCRPRITKLTEEDFRSYLADDIENFVKHHYETEFDKNTSEPAEDLRKAGAIDTLAKIIYGDRSPPPPTKQSKESLSTLFENGGKPTAQAVLDHLGIKNPMTDHRYQAYTFVVKALGTIDKKKRNKLPASATLRGSLEREIDKFSYTVDKETIKPFAGQHKAKVLEMLMDASEGKLTSNIADEKKHDQAWRKQRQLFKTRCSAAHTENDLDSKRKYCRSATEEFENSRARNFTLEDYKEYIRKRENGEINKSMKFYQYVIDNDLGLKKPAAKKTATKKPAAKKTAAKKPAAKKSAAKKSAAKKTAAKKKKISESIVQRWKELAGIIKG
jgi:hypothetical protein